MQSVDRRGTTSLRRGMTVLGKIPSVPKPINLPSQRLENRGLDPNVEIVPKGSMTWGNTGKSPPTTAGSWSSTTSSSAPTLPTNSSSAPQTAWGSASGLSSTTVEANSKAWPSIEESTIGGGSTGTVLVVETSKDESSGNLEGRHPNPWSSQIQVPGSGIQKVEEKEKDADAHGKEEKGDDATLSDSKSQLQNAEFSDLADQKHNSSDQQGEPSGQEKLPETRQESHSNGKETRNSSNNSPEVIQSEGDRWRSEGRGHHPSSEIWRRDHHEGWRRDPGPPPPPDDNWRPPYPPHHQGGPMYRGGPWPRGYQSQPPIGYGGRGGYAPMGPGGMYPPRGYEHFGGGPPPPGYLEEMAMYGRGRGGFGGGFGGPMPPQAGRAGRFPSGQGQGPRRGGPGGNGGGRGGPQGGMVQGQVEAVKEGNSPASTEDPPMEKLPEDEEQKKGFEKLESEHFDWGSEAEQEFNPPSFSGPEVGEKPPQEGEGLGRGKGVQGQVPNRPMGAPQHSYFPYVPGPMMPVGPPMGFRRFQEGAMMGAPGRPFHQRDGWRYPSHPHNGMGGDFRRGNNPSRDLDGRWRRNEGEKRVEERAQVNHREEPKATAPENLRILKRPEVEDGQESKSIGGIGGESVKNEVQPEPEVKVSEGKVGELGQREATKVNQEISARETPSAGKSDSETVVGETEKKASEASKLTREERESLEDPEKSVREMEKRNVTRKFQPGPGMGPQGYDRRQHPIGGGIMRGPMQMHDYSTPYFHQRAPFHSGPTEPPLLPNPQFPGRGLNPDIRPAVGPRIPFQGSRAPYPHHPMAPPPQPPTLPDSIHAQNTHSLPAQPGFGSGFKPVDVYHHPAYPRGLKGLTSHHDPGTQVDFSNRLGRGPHPLQGTARGPEPVGTQIPAVYEGEERMDRGRVQERQKFDVLGAEKVKVEREVERVTRKEEEEAEKEVQVEEEKPKVRRLAPGLTMFGEIECDLTDISKPVFGLVEELPFREEPQTHSSLQAEKVEDTTESPQSENSKPEVISPVKRENFRNGPVMRTHGYHGGRGGGRGDVRHGPGGGRGLGSGFRPVHEGGQRPVGKVVESTVGAQRQQGRPIPGSEKTSEGGKSQHSKQNRPERKFYAPKPLLQLQQQQIFKEAEEEGKELPGKPEGGDEVGEEQSVKPPSQGPSTSLNFPRQGGPGRGGPSNRGSLGHHGTQGTHGTHGTVGQGPGHPGKRQNGPHGGKPVSTGGNENRYLGNSGGRGEGVRGGRRGGGRGGGLGRGGHDLKRVEKIVREQVGPNCAAKSS